MNVIAAVRLGGNYGFFEAEYLMFVLDLSSRLEEPHNTVRGGLLTVTTANAPAYVAWMTQYRLDPDELQEDYEGLPEAEKVESEAEFLPTVLIDFDERTFYCSHPEAHYLNFADYLPRGWRYESTGSVPSLIPTSERYWAGW